MKRLISFILAALMVLSLAACNSKKPQTSDDIQVEDTTKKVVYKSKDSIAKVKIPVELIEEKYRDDLDAYCEAYGYEGASLNKRTQTVTLKMKHMRYSLMLTQIGMEVVSGLYNVLEDGTYKYFKDIESFDDENFSEVTILVNEKSYKNDSTSSLLPFTLAQTCFVYQMYTEAGIDKCDIIIKNAKTKEVIETKTYTEKDA